MGRGPGLLVWAAVEVEHLVAFLADAHVPMLIALLEPGFVALCTERPEVLAGAARVLLRDRARQVRAARHARRVGRAVGEGGHCDSKGSRVTGRADFYTFEVRCPLSRIWHENGVREIPSVLPRAPKRRFFEALGDGRGGRT